MPLCAFFLHLPYIHQNVSHPFICSRATSNSLSTGERTNRNCERFSEIPGQKSTAKDILTNQLFNLQQGINVKPKTTIVLEIIGTK
jgi:hypothetical protein